VVQSDMRKTVSVSWWLSPKASGKDGYCEALGRITAGKNTINREMEMWSCMTM
jgi:hypothetical protein